MEHRPPNFDASRAWSDAMALLNGQREIVLTVAGFFMLLPPLLLNTLHPFTPSGQSGTWLREVGVWTEANFLWILLVALMASLGRLTLLILLLGPERPSVGEALRAGVRLLPLFAVMDLLIGFMWLGGLMLFVIPWLYLAGRTFLAEAAFVARRVHGPVAGIAAGFEATRRNGWRLFFIIAVIYLAGTILIGAIGSVVGVFGALFGGAGLNLFLNAFVDAAGGAGISMLLLLVAVAAWRQLGSAEHA
ncbi:hypothetical protein ACFSCW_14420 [Sphingomonas tabacisoli]|uniref:Glycerophosphoryl diester phosphodiesterase membrane domain-containing protein n=1 Tax=Sphingomonas tabacisoli TaxID=2249466 RepID=A0ABW4I6C3_9SPHN